MEEVFLGAVEAFLEADIPPLAAVFFDVAGLAFLEAAAFLAAAAFLDGAFFEAVLFLEAPPFLEAAPFLEAPPVLEAPLAFFEAVLAFAAVPLRALPAVRDFDVVLGDLAISNSCHVLQLRPVPAQDKP